MPRGICEQTKHSLNFIDLTGQEFGRLIVIKRISNSKRGRTRWLCRCSCGGETIVYGCHLRDGHTKSCGCFKKETTGGQNKLTSGLASMHAVIKDYKDNAKTRGYDFNLTEEQFKELTQQECYYCGAKPRQMSKTKKYNGIYIYNGLDRVDNTKGYSLQNVVPCCKQCNWAKSNLTLQEFNNWIEKIHNRTLKRKSEMM